jgi:hypothetical protein
MDLDMNALDMFPIVQLDQFHFGLIWWIGFYCGVTITIHARSTNENPIISWTKPSKLTLSNVLQTSLFTWNMTMLSCMVHLCEIDRRVCCNSALLVAYAFANAFANEICWSSCEED